MKIQVRQGTFETNSSSTHSLSVYEIKDWNGFKEGNLFMEGGLGAIFSEEDIHKRHEEYLKDYPNSEMDFDEFKEDWGFYTYEDLCERYELLEEEVPGGIYIAVSLEGWD